MGRLGGSPSRALSGARVRLRRGRFEDLVERQLELFEAADEALLDEARVADAAWTSATAEESEELYGAYQLVADSIGERLYETRETYAATLEAGPAIEYRAAFDKEARRRFRRYSALLAEGTD
jgi:hypothetical protein